MEFVTPETARLIRSLAKDLVENKQIRTDMIYRRMVSKTVAPGTGVATIVWSDTAIKGYNGQFSTKEVGASGGNLQVGDWFVVFDPSKLTSIPVIEDRILIKVADRGFVSIAQNAAALSGVETAFSDDGIQGGDFIEIDGTEALIKTVTDQTNIVLKNNWPAANKDFVKYAVYRPFKIIDWDVDPLNAAMRISIRKAGA